MTAWAAAAWSLAGLSGATSAALALYLDLRIHAGIQAGTLPASTPRLFEGSGWPFRNGFRIGTVFSRSFLDADPHSRVLTPILRVALIVFPASLIAAPLLT